MAANRSTAAAPRTRLHPAFGALSRIRPRPSSRARAWWPGALIVAALVLGGHSFSAAPVLAQRWTASLDAGRATFDVGARDIETSHLVLGVQYVRPALWFGASLSPAVSGGDPLWGGVWGAAMPRAVRGDWTAGVDIGAQVYGQDDPTELSSGVGAGGDFLPVLSYRASPVLEAGVSGGAQVYYSGFGAADTDFTRTVGVAEVFVMVTPERSPVELVGSVRHLFAEEAGYTLMEARAYGASGRISGWASVGTWLNDFVETTPWDLGGALRVVDRAWIRAGIRREAFDPLYLSDDRTTWSLGASVTLGPSPKGSLVGDVPVPVQSAADETELRLSDDVTGPVSVAGDFTAWEPRPMRLEGEEWVYRARLPPGVYHYAFVGSAGEWFVPEGTPGRIDDGMGGWVAVLIVDE